MALSGRANDPKLEQLARDVFAMFPNCHRCGQTIASLTPAVTVLTITHRLTTARQADHVVVLDQGAVVAEGPWETLLAGEDSRLARLWTAQLGLDDELVPQDGPHSS